MSKPKSQKTHNPKITTHTSGCTCGWTGPLRGDNEKQGAFTMRSVVAHRAHIEDEQCAHGEMFAALTGLFVDSEVSI